MMWLGATAFAEAIKLKLPPNITPIRLPDVEIARNYPTLGAQGAHNVDVNGQAASIEMYLGRHNLVGADGQGLIDDDALPVLQLGTEKTIELAVKVLENLRVDVLALGMLTCMRIAFDLSGISHSRFIRQQPHHRLFRADQWTWTAGTPWRGGLYRIMTAGFVLIRLIRSQFVLASPEAG